jgi:anti-sigma factor RsiW
MFVHGTSSIRDVSYRFFAAEAILDVPQANIIMPQFQEEYLSAYLDSTLDTASTQEVEHRLSTDTALEAEYRSVRAVKHLLAARQDRLRLVAPVEVRRSVMLKIEQEMVRSASLASIQEGETLHEQLFIPTNKHQRALQPTATVYPLPRSNQGLNKSMWESRNYLVAAVVVFALGFGVIRFLVHSLQPSQAQQMRPFANEAPAATLIAQSTLLREAVSNHDAVTSGKLSLQFATNSFKDLDQFFRKNGVTCNLVYPRIADARLLGGVVSEENGRKSAHLVFEHHKTLLYMWEIEETPATISHVGITPKAWQILQTGEWIWDTTTSNAATVIFWEEETEKSRRTLCALVAAMPREKLQPLFQ